MPITAANGTTYSDDQIQQWLAGKSPDQIASEAAQLGLNQSQIQQAMQIGGQNVSASDINNYAQTHGYQFGANGSLQTTPAGTGGAGQPAQYAVNPNAAGGNIQGGSNGMTSGVLTTQGGKQVTHQQLTDFAAMNPDDQAIMSFAQRNGMSSGDVATALNNLGLLYNGGNATSSQLNDPKNGSIYNRILGDLAYGSTGYGMTANPGGNTSPRDALITGGWNPSPTGGQGWGTAGVTGAPGAVIGDAVLTGTGNQPGGAGPLTMTAGGSGMYTPGGNVFQPGQTTGSGGAGGGSPFGGLSQAPSFQTPVLDALYQSEQQRMQAPAPTFNFQSKPQTAAPGALTQAIAGP